MDDKRINNNPDGLFKGEHSGFFKYALGVTIAMILFLCFGKGGNVMHWIGAKQEIARQERQKAMYMESTRRMKEEIRHLKDNPDSLEKWAREKFQFAAEGDDVYIVK